MKRLFLVMVTILLLLSTMLSFGAECSTSLTTPKISEATLALWVDGNSKPVDATNKFYVDTPAIYCSLKVSNAPAGSDITSVWNMCRENSN